jgi:hypothetical protein
MRCTLPVGRLNIALLPVKESLYLYLDQWALEYPVESACDVGHVSAQMVE